MIDDRDVAAFGERADRYDDGWLGRFHHEVAQRVASVVDSVIASPSRILDVGCGTGYLLALLAQRYPDAEKLAGIDASAAMVAVARTLSLDPRIQVREAIAEQLPFGDAEFDLIVSTTSFDHWRDQAAGLRECARVLDRDGVLVLADLFSPLLRPTLIGARRGKARTRARAELLLSGAGHEIDSWHRIEPFIRAFVARGADR